MNETPCFNCENLGEGKKHIHCGSIHVLRKRERKNPYFTHLLKNLLGNSQPKWLSLVFRSAQRTPLNDTGGVSGRKCLRDVHR